MTHQNRICISAILVSLLLSCGAHAQWRQLPIPLVHGKMGSATNGTLYVLTNGTLCIADASKYSWTYEPFPYDLNDQGYGLSHDDPPSQLLVATDDTLVFLSNIGDVYYIETAGMTLCSAMEGLRSKLRMNPNPYLLASRGKNGELLLCHDDLYESWNNGATWDIRYKHPIEGYSFSPGAVDGQNRETMFLYDMLGGSKIYKTTDNAHSWRLVHSDIWKNIAEDMLICPNGQIYAGMYYSNDSGDSWIEYTMDPNGVYRSRNNMKYVYNERDQSIYALNEGNGLFCRKHGDTMFQKTKLASSSVTESPRRGIDLSYELGSGKMYAIINDTLYEYQSGTVKSLSQSLYGAGVCALSAYNDSGDSLLLCTPNTMIMSTNGGDVWLSTSMYGGGSNRIALTFSKRTEGLLYRYRLPLPYYTGIYEDGRERNKRIWDISSCRLTYDPFSIDTFYGGVNRVWKMTDSIVLHADSNAILYGEYIDTPSLIHRLGCISFDTRRKGVMLLGGSDRDGQPFLYRTNDLGSQWDRISSIPLKQPPIEIIFDPAIESRILVFDATGVYVSTNDGASWEYRDPGLGVRNATCVAVDPEDPSTVFLGVVSPSRTEAIPQSRAEGGGVWMSRDGCYSWSKLPIDGLFNYNVSHVLALRNPRRILVGTPCGAYEYLLDSTSAVVPKREEAVLVLNVYPNPSNESIQVSWGTTSTCSGEFRVIDQLGRVVYTQEIEPGSTSTTWDASIAAPGVYFMQIMHEKGIATGKVIVR